MNGGHLLPFVEYYGEMGIRTFPIWNGPKVPARGSHGHHDATTDPQTFELLLQRFQGRGGGVGLAARMGDGGLVCLDVDEKDGKSGSWTLRVSRFEIPATLSASTRSGGKHYLFRSEYPLKSQASWLGTDSGLDIKGVGGWIAVAPTSGYEWDQEPTLDAIAPVPDWLVSRSVRGRPRRSDADSDVVSREMVCCPVHNDSRPSLQVTVLRTGETLYHCFAGCQWGEVALVMEGYR